MTALPPLDNVLLWEAEIKATGANKKPYADSKMADFAQLSSPTGLKRARYEATVVAGVPVIASLLPLVLQNQHQHHPHLEFLSS